MSATTAYLDEHLIEEKEYQGDNKLITGIVLGVITFWLFAQSVVNIVPDMQRDLGMDLGSLNLAISLTSLFSGCFVVAGGGLADKFGRVKLTQIGLALSVLSSLCLIFSQGAPSFFLGRVIQGLSAACIMPATLALMKTYFEGKERQRALSFWSIGSWGGSGLCSLAGGAIATYMGWRWIFVICLACALLGMMLVKGTPESKVEQNGKSRFDTLGLILFVTAMISLNLIITKGSSLGWGSPIILGMAAVFMVAAVAFARLESLKKDQALIDFSLFRNMPYSGATLSNFMLNAVAGTLLIINTYIQSGRGFTPFQTGMLSIGYLIAVLGMIRVGERVLQRVGAKKPMILGTMITGVGIGLMTLTFLPGTLYMAAVLAGFVMFGLGLGFYATPSTDTAISNSPADKVGVASGVYKMASSLGGAFGVAISASVYAALLHGGADTATAATAGLLVNVGFCILSVLAVVCMVPESAGKE